MKVIMRHGMREGKKNEMDDRKNKVDGNEGRQKRENMRALFVKNEGVRLERLSEVTREWMTRNN